MNFESNQSVLYNGTEADLSTFEQVSNRDVCRTYQFPDDLCVILFFVVDALKASSMNTVLTGSYSAHVTRPDESDEGLHRPPLR